MNALLAPLRGGGVLPFLALVAVFLAFPLPGDANALGLSPIPLGGLTALVVVAAAAFLRGAEALGIGLGLIASFAGAALLIDALPNAPMPSGSPGMSQGFWFALIAVWLLAWTTVDRIAGLTLRHPLARRAADLAIPVLFGAWLLILWEVLVRGLGVPPVLLPAPSAIGARLVAETATLWADFRQTFLHSVLIGWALGCGAGFLVALVVDRVPFLKSGLLPVGNLVSALPIVGIAPIMVMWFGFDWPSKAAVVVVMTFFPMLVNTLAGLDASGRMERDLMRTYAAGHGQELLKLRLPAAMPFVFNALKINCTLALIGAIVAEFFGTPTVGMGFRISTEVGRMAIDMVWAEIAVAALAGSLFYAAIGLVERFVTFWHPSMRR
ncbi:ABC transporter permease [Mongoliimonas terrestris]|uniref:ABC transporter permease n=1 Tax=Mongoliimonas terrestris TaxID=1709001 RepID=UPI000A917705